MAEASSPRIDLAQHSLLSRCGSAGAAALKIPHQIFFSMRPSKIHTTCAGVVRRCGEAILAPPPGLGRLAKGAALLRGRERGASAVQRRATTNNAARSNKQLTNTRRCAYLFDRERSAVLE